MTQKEDNRPNNRASAQAAGIAFDPASQPVSWSSEAGQESRESSKGEEATETRVDAKKPKVTFRSILQKPAVRALWIASLISYVGDTFSTLALFILVNHVTHSTVAIAAVGAVQLIPLVFAIVAGVLVDRWRYRPVLLAADLARLLLVPAYLLFGSSDELWLLLVITMAVSIASRFFFPASSALRRALLQPGEYSVAASLWQTTYGASYVIGPALAGVLIAAFGSDVHLGVSVAFLVDALSFGVSALIIFLFVSDHARSIDDQRVNEPRPGTWSDVREGWGIMWRSNLLRGVVVLYSVGLLGVGAVFVLTVPYVQQVFHGGALEVGLLEATQAFGLAVGASLVGLGLVEKLQPSHIMLWASLIGALSVIGIGLAPLFAAALAIMCFAGVAAGAVESSGAAITIHEIPQRHQGKGNSSINSLLNLSYLASVSLAGVGGDLLGIRGTFVAGGVVALLGVALAFPFLATRRRAERAAEHKP